MNKTTFKRGENGGYVTPDGRFTVTPWRNCTGTKPGSAGRREWMVTGTMVDSRAVSTLADARDMIAWVMNAQEAQ